MSEPVAETTPTEPTTEAAAQQPTDWEAEAKKWEKRSKDNYAKLRDAEPKLAELEQIRAAQMTEAERLTADLTRWQTEAEQWRSAAVGSRIETLAATDFADPSDAIAAIGDPTRFLDAGGQINEGAIRQELAAVLERKPHWRRPDGSASSQVATRLPAPNAAQGTGGTAASDPGATFGSILQGLARGGT